MRDPSASPELGGECPLRVVLPRLCLAVLGVRPQAAPCVSYTHRNNLRRYARASSSGSSSPPISFHRASSFDSGAGQARNVYDGQPFQLDAGDGSLTTAPLILQASEILH